VERHELLNESSSEEVGRETKRCCDSSMLARNMPARNTTICCFGVIAVGFLAVWIMQVLNVLNTGGCPDVPPLRGISSHIFSPNTTLRFDAWNPNFLLGDDVPVVDTPASVHVGYWREAWVSHLYTRYDFIDEQEQTLLKVRPVFNLFHSEYQVERCGTQSVYTLKDTSPWFGWMSVYHTWEVRGSQGVLVATCYYSLIIPWWEREWWEGNITAPSGVQIGRIRQSFLSAIDTEWSVSNFRPDLLPNYVLGVLAMNFAATDSATSGSSGGSFARGTLVQSQNGSWLRIEEVQIGDSLALGGRVQARMEFEAAWSELFLYSPPAKGVASEEHQGIVVCGGHAVQELGHWLRVRDAKGARRLTAEHHLSLASETKVRVYDFDVEHHRLRIRPVDGLGSAVVFADFSEVDQDLPLVADFEKDLLASLNSDEL